ncbi:MAG: hypothetical protein EOO13_19420 [Chitinophagaceae bacterium]|nr:MAG: hypothetical protein EOO13_19420 [Chitinophagaceae bacterium]
MKKLIPFLCVAAAVAFSLTACKKETETLQTASIEDYSPLVVGKYITYRLDSFVYTNFGVNSETRTYQVKHQVDAQITDNLGRPAYRIIRYIRKTASNPWVSDASFMAVNTGNGLEFTENNLRYIKLRTPVRDFYSWKGNSFIDTYSINSELKYMDDWDYVYDSVNVPLTIGNFTLDSTIKVDQRDEIIGFPELPGSYSEINYGVEKYAKGIGMVYRRFFHSEYQPPTPGQGGRFVDGSYGVTLTMIDHN